MFHPKGPNLFLSRRVEWKKHKAKKILLILGSFSSISSFGINYQAFFIFGLKPAGGSYVNLIHLSKIPIGIPGEGSEDMNSKKLALLYPSLL